MELTLNNFSLNFLGKDRLAIRKLFLDIDASHQHIGILRTTSITSDLCFCVSLEKHHSAGFEAALHQTMQSLSNNTREVRGDRNDRAIKILRRFVSRKVGHFRSDC